MRASAFEPTGYTPENTRLIHAECDRKGICAAAPYREIVRQQWNFSPPNTVRELEDYRVELSNVAALELIISPDIGEAGAVASLTQLRIG